MEEQKPDDHRSKTRYLRPVESTTFSSSEILSALFSVIHPSLVSSVNLLRGERKGVVRMTLKTSDALYELDQKLDSRKIQVNGVRLAAVGENGHFLRVTLFDVPEYLNSEDIERDLQEYGTVVHVKREYVDYRGHKIENETRQVLFSTFHKDIPSRITMDGHFVFVSYKSPLRPRSRGEHGNGSRHFPVTRSVSVATGTQSSSCDQESVDQEKLRHGGRVAGRASSPLVTPETEKLPEIGNMRPRHVIASPQPYRPPCVQTGTQTKSSVSESAPRAGPARYSVEVQVEPQAFLPRATSHPDQANRSWASGYSGQDGGRHHYDNTETGPRMVDIDRGYVPHRTEEYETKI